MEYLFIYLIQLAYVLRVIASILVIISVAIIFLLLVANLAPCEAKEQFDSKKWHKRVIMFCLISFLIFLTPSPRTLVFMGGTYLGKQAVTTIKTNATKEKLCKIIDLKLNDYIKELTSD